MPKDPHPSTAHTGTVLSRETMARRRAERNMRQMERAESGGEPERSRDAGRPWEERE